MRILHVSNYYPEHIGGIETVAANLTAGYREKGHQVRWVAGDILTDPHATHSGDVPLRVWNGIEGIGFPYPLPAPSAVYRVRELVEWSEVVHIHDCLYAINVATFAAAHRRRRPVLLTQHVATVPYPNPVVRGLQSAAYATIGRAVLSRAETVAFVSEEVKAWFEARLRFRKPPVVIENGIDTALFQPAAESDRTSIRAAQGADGSRPRLLFVGRFVEKKGVRLLRPLIERTPEYDWVMIGRSGDVDPAGWGLRNLRVMPSLKQPELRDHYVAADLLVLPSTGEGFPVVAQEAMACGTPALLNDKIAAGIPSMRDIVFTTTLAGNDLDIALRNAVPAASAAHYRERVAAYAGARWGIESMVSRYEDELEALLR